MIRGADITGMTFERLTVLERDAKDPRRWICECACGRVTSTRKDHLLHGGSRSCGCLRMELSTGLSKTKLYKTWDLMRRRCSDPKHKSYPNYGGRGIGICDRWRFYESFVEDMGERPDGMTLDRRDNNLGYSKENCRWATASEQMQNRRCIRLNAEKVRSIRARCGAGDTRAAVAVDFGVSTATVHYILRGDTWKNVT